MSDTNLIQLASRISSLYNQTILDAHRELLNNVRSAAPKGIETSLTTPLNFPQEGARPHEYRFGDDGLGRLSGDERTHSYVLHSVSA